MKKILMTLMFIGACMSNSFAQGGMTVEWGESFDAKTEVQKIIGTQDGVMYTYAKKGKKTFLQGFRGSNHKLEFSTEYKLPERNGKKTQVLDMVMTSNGPLAIGYNKDKKTGKLKVYAYSFSLAGKLKTSGSVILETQDIGKVKNKKIMLELSRDKSKILFAYMRLQKKTYVYDVDVVVIDEDLNVLSVRTAEHDFTEEKGQDLYYGVEVHLDNDGSYISTVERALYRKNETPEYSFTIRDFNTDGTKEGEKVVNFEEKGIYKPYIFFDENENSFRVVGMYAEFHGRKNKVIGYSGVYNAIIERGSLDVLEKHLTPFPDDFMVKLTSEKLVKKAAAKDKELYVSSHFGIDHVYLTPEGNLIVSAEYYSKVQTTRDGKKYTTWTYGDIMVMNLNSDGGLDWISLIPKRQMTTQQDLPIGFGGIMINISMPEPAILNNWSYVPGMGEDHFYLLFNDHRKNAKREEDKEKTLGNPKKSIPYLVTVDLETGGYVKKPMINAADEETYLAPKVIYRNADNEYVVWAVKRKENKFGVVVFD